MKITALCLSVLLAAAAAQQSPAVASVHNDCGSTCTYTNDCCGSDSTCYGSITKRCCPNTSSFCGCYSMRGFCSGFVYDSDRVNGSDSFGACYDTSLGSCTVDNSANRWIVCPNTYTSCPSNSGFSCCSSGQTCYTNSGASFATCAAPSGGPDVIFPQPGQTLVYNQAYTFRYTPAVAGDTNYNIITGGNNQAFGSGTLNSDGSVSIPYTLRSFSPQNGVIQLTFAEGNVSTTVSVNAAVAAPSTTSAATQATVAEAPIDTKDCPNGCAGGALCCGGQCYSTGQYTCYTRDDGSHQLCPNNTGICGSACYDTASYRCNNGQLAQA